MQYYELNAKYKEFIYIERIIKEELECELKEKDELHY